MSAMPPVCWQNCCKCMAIVIVFVESYRGVNAGFAEAGSRGHLSYHYRREQASDLLKRGWPGGSAPRFDADAALVLCRMRGFTPGLLFLYERMRLHREVLRVRCHKNMDQSVLRVRFS